jgi:hypothetical protein
MRLREVVMIFRVLKINEFCPKNFLVNQKD